MKADFTAVTEIVEFLTRGSRSKNKITARLRRAYFGLFKDHLGRISWDEALEGRMIQKTCQIFSNNLLQCQEDCPNQQEVRQKNARRPVCMN